MVAYYHGVTVIDKTKYCQLAAYSIQVSHYLVVGTCKLARFPRAHKLARFHFIAGFKLQ